MRSLLTGGPLRLDRGDVAAVVDVVAGCGDDPAAVDFGGKAGEFERGFGCQRGAAGKGQGQGVRLAGDGGDLGVDGGLG